MELCTETNESDIVAYICDKTQQNVKLHKIITKRQDQKSFKFFVSENNLSMFLDERLWPRGIIFRRFINYKLLYASSQYYEHGSHNNNFINNNG